VLVEEKIYSARRRSLYGEPIIQLVTRIINKKATVIFTMSSFYKKLHGWSSLVCHWV